MEDAPVYTLLTREQVEELIHTHYDLGRVVEYKKLSGGLANSNYRVDTTTGSYLLKICDEKDRQSLQVQVAALNAVRAVHFPTCLPHPLKGAEGYVLCQNNDQLRAIVYDFLRLAQGGPGTIEGVTERMMAQLGTAVATLHTLSPVDNLPPFPMGVAAIDPFLEEVKGTPFEHHEFVRYLREQLNAFRGVIADPTLPQGMMHGDIFPDNVMFDGEELVGIVDFEEVCHGPLLVDVGMTILGCCYPRDNKLDEGLMQAFVTAYDAKRPMSVQEKAQLPQFIQYAALTIAFWRFRQFNVRTQDELRKDRHQEMVQRIAHITHTFLAAPPLLPAPTHLS
ncbi:homoserine kinase, putative [Acanthamoeba castellanii str. Neff]|uniref:Homoserine kinase, putative n=1 Tax=Acanthamoeba castellanii (strain ATCC 30010 / Neff) TaxID=1257118 RepID=L8GH67_ACACF|nr:homoserine kinase, putative [Acanthamoeba castellanii str. Neff]ELR11536.1 homoserine kinase, putative [Acanthamoeba castellanii str. Neff]